MNLPIGIIDAPAHIVRATGPAPVIATGRVSSSGPDLEIRLDEPPSQLVSGDQVILSFFDVRLPKVIANVTTAGNGTLRCAPRLVKEQERRYYPRMFGGIQLRYRNVGQGAASQAIARAWLAGDPMPAREGRWVVPDEFMNFSVTGLAFDTITGCHTDDLVLLEMGLRNGEERWRATARVIRVIPVPEDELDASVNVDGQAVSDRVAVNFEQIPSSAQAKLVDMTMSIQEALI